MDDAAPLSPDQVVSRNLMRARELRGWTQQEAAAAISRHLGREWTVSAVAGAERSHRTPRVKEFSATEITAFCRAFRLPLAWFYLPPHPWTPIRPRGAAEDAEFTAGELLSLIFPRIDDPMTAELAEATKTLFSEFASRGPQREDLATYLGWVGRQDNALQMMVRNQFAALGLAEMPAQLADLSSRMSQALGLVVNDLQHDGIPPADERGASR